MAAEQSAILHFCYCFLCLWKSESLPSNPLLLMKNKFSSSVNSETNNQNLSFIEVTFWFNLFSLTVIVLAKSLLRSHFHLEIFMWVGLYEKLSNNVDAVYDWCEYYRTMKFLGRGFKTHNAMPQHFINTNF